MIRRLSNPVSPRLMLRRDSTSKTKANLSKLLVNENWSLFTETLSKELQGLSGENKSVLIDYLAEKSQVEQIVAAHKTASIFKAVHGLCNANDLNKLTEAFANHMMGKAVYNADVTEFIRESMPEQSQKSSAFQKLELVDRLHNMDSKGYIIALENSSASEGVTDVLITYLESIIQMEVLSATYEMLERSQSRAEVNKFIEKVSEELRENPLLNDDSTKFAKSIGPYENCSHEQLSKVLTSCSIETLNLHTAALQTSLNEKDESVFIGVLANIQTYFWSHSGAALLSVFVLPSNTKALADMKMLVTVDQKIFSKSHIHIVPFREAVFSWMLCQEKFLPYFEEYSKLLSDQQRDVLQRHFASESSKSEFEELTLYI